MCPHEQRERAAGSEGGLVPPQTEPTKVANDNAAFSQWSENVAR